MQNSTNKVFKIFISITLLFCIFLGNITAMKRNRVETPTYDPNKLKEYTMENIDYAINMLKLDLSDKQKKQIESFLLEPHKKIGLRLNTIKLQKGKNTCNICLEPMTIENLLVYHKTPENIDLETPENIDHVFHLQCLDSWFKEKRTNNETPTCPLCRQPININQEDTNGVDFYPALLELDRNLLTKNLEKLKENLYKRLSLLAIIYSYNKQNLENPNETQKKSLFGDYVDFYNKLGTEKIDPNEILKQTPLKIVGLLNLIKQKFFFDESQKTFLTETQIAKSIENLLIKLLEESDNTEKTNLIIETTYSIIKKIIDQNMDIINQNQRLDLIKELAKKIFLSKNKTFMPKIFEEIILIIKQQLKTASKNGSELEKILDLNLLLLIYFDDIENENLIKQIIQTTIESYINVYFFKNEYFLTNFRRKSKLTRLKEDIYMNAWIDENNNKLIIDTTLKILNNNWKTKGAKSLFNDLYEKIETIPDEESKKEIQKFRDEHSGILDLLNF